MRWRVLIAWFALLPLVSHATQADQIKASHAWIRLLPADLPAAGYVMLTNQGASDAALISAQSSAYGSVMLHQSTHATGSDTMHMLDRLNIPAHGQVALAPAGYHLMLQQATRPMKPGDTIDVVLTFADGSRLQVPFLLRPANATD